MKTLISKLKYQMRRHPFLHKARWFMITKPPKSTYFKDEHYNAYNTKKDIHPIFFEDNPITDAEQPLSTLVKVIKIAEHFNNFFKKGRGLGLASDDSYIAMRYKQGGVCSDFAQVFINFCIINDIKIREWGIKGSTKGTRGGHSFNEFWSEELKKWILIDVYNGIFIINKSSRELLSVSQLVDYISGFNTYNLDFELMIDTLKPLDKVYLAKYFFDNRNLFFLLTNYRIKKVDAFLKHQNKVPLAILHTGLIFFKRYFNYRFYVNDKNLNHVRQTLRPVIKYNYAPELNASKLRGDAVNNIEGAF